MSDLLDTPRQGENAPEFTVSELSGQIKALIEGQFGYVRIRGEKVRMQFKPNDAAATNAYALRGALARLGSCNREWCEITAEGVSGWARKDQLWGVFADELRD